MSELLVFAFDNETGAGEAIASVQALQKQQLITLSDAATVVRKPDGKVKVKLANNKEVGGTIQPGHSALFLMVEQMTEDRVVPELSKSGAKLLRTNLSAEDEAKLRAAFGAEESGASTAA